MKNKPDHLKDIVFLKNREQLRQFNKEQLIDRYFQAEKTYAVVFAVMFFLFLIGICGAAFFGENAFNFKDDADDYRDMTITISKSYCEDKDQFFMSAGLESDGDVYIECSDKAYLFEAVE